MSDGEEGRTYSTFDDKGQSAPTKNSHDMRR